MRQIVFWSRLGFCYDPPLYSANGFPLVFDPEFTELKYHRQMYDAGIDVHSFILHSGWVGDGEYDYRLTDKVMETAAKIGENAKFLLRVKLNAPVSWCKNHPEDVFVYDMNLRDPAEISSLCGTLKQDYLGYESAAGYYMQNDPAFRRPNVGGRIALQSFSSEKWLEDASTALSKLIEHLEPYRERIIGYHIAWGACGESMLWGRGSCRYGDYGINHRLKFWDFGARKYGDPHKIWGLSDSDSRENYQMPTPDERYNRSGDEFYRTDPVGAMARDLDEFLGEANFAAAERFGRVAKTLHPGARVGIFYGYYLFIPNANYTGHLNLGKMLNSPYIDFLSAPKSYSFTMPGEPGGEMCPSRSVNLSKQWIEELDVRTHIAAPSGWTLKSLDETKTSLARELARNLSRGSGFWWMDLGGGWYDDPEILAWVTKLNATAKYLDELPAYTTADILVLTDEASMLWRGAKKSCEFPIFFADLALTGADYDSYRLADLPRLDISRYKVIIFAECQLLTPETLAEILRSSDAKIVFSGDTGVIRDGKFSRGFMAELEKIASDAGRLSDLETAISGCDLSPNGTFVYRDNRFVAIFSSGGEIDSELELPFDSWRELFSDEVGMGRKVRLKLAPKAGKFYVMHK